VPESIRLRRASCLLAYWDDGEFVLEHYLTHKRTVTSPLIVHLLDGLQSDLPQEIMIERFRAIPGAVELIEQLTRQDVLVVAGSELDRKEGLLDTTWAWPLSARYFHYSAQQVRYEDDFTVEWASLARLAQETPPPSPFKDYGVTDVALADGFESQEGEFWDVLLARRTQRSFARQPLSWEDFSTVLQWTWGHTQLITDPDVGPYILRTSPSGGARHPIEVYPIVLRVTGVPSGIYHYSVERHQLTRLRAGLFEDLTVRLCANQSWVRDASAVFMMTAVLARSMWKYKQAQAYRVLQLEAGHLGQTFHLVCTALGLAPFTTAATDEAGIEQVLGLDGVSEIAIYAAATGIPATKSS
jgi:SagB-type dehydrogenase family enzyme